MLQRLLSSFIIYLHSQLNNHHLQSHLAKNFPTFLGMLLYHHNRDATKATKSFQFLLPRSRQIGTNLLVWRILGSVHIPVVSQTSGCPGASAGRRFGVVCPVLSSRISL